MTTESVPPVKLPRKACQNPDCDKGAGNRPKEFIPQTTWQKDCSDECRNRRNYLLRKARKESLKSDPEKAD